MKSFQELLDTSKIAKQEALQGNTSNSQQHGLMESTGKTNIQNTQQKQSNQQQMTTAPKELHAPFVDMLNSKDIDWDDNCNFENGKVVSFKTNKATNNYHLRPIPSGERALNDAREAQRTLLGTMRPATMEQLSVTFKRLYIVSGKQNRNAAEMESMFMDYYYDLKTYPIKLIEDACAAYRRLPEGNEFMPTSGKIISLLEVAWAKMLFQKSRTEKLLTSARSKGK